MANNYKFERVDYVIARLYDDGNLSYSVIGDKLGLTRNQIAGKVLRLRKKGLITTEADPARVHKVRYTKRRKLPIMKKPQTKSRKNNYIHNKRNNNSSTTKEQMNQRMLKAKEIVRQESEGNGSVSLLNLKQIHCRWLYNDGLYCGEETVLNSYCSKHAYICYQRVDHLVLMHVGEN